MKIKLLLVLGLCYSTSNLIAMAQPEAPRIISKYQSMVDKPDYHRLFNLSDTALRKEILPPDYPEIFSFLTLNELEILRQDFELYINTLEQDLREIKDIFPYDLPRYKTILAYYPDAANNMKAAYLALPRILKIYKQELATIRIFISDLSK